MVPKKPCYWNGRFKREPFPWGKAQSKLADMAQQIFHDAGHKRILDLGCGSGRDSVYLARKGFNVVGMDPSHLAIRIARNWAKRSNLRIRFLREELQSTRLRPNSFDGIFSYNSLQYLLTQRERKMGVEKLVQILKPNGLLVLSVFSEREKSKKKGRDVHLFTRKELLDLFSPHFEIIELKRIAFPEEHGGKRHVHQEWLFVGKRK